MIQLHLIFTKRQLWTVFLKLRVKQRPVEWPMQRQP